jgi:hypothetical protein
MIDQATLQRRSHSGRHAHLIHRFVIFIFPIPCDDHFRAGTCLLHKRFIKLIALCDSVFPRLRYFYLFYPTLTPSCREFSNAATLPKLRNAIFSSKPSSEYRFGPIIASPIPGSLPEVPGTNLCFYLRIVHAEISRRRAQPGSLAEVSPEIRMHTDGACLREEDRAAERYPRWAWNSARPGLSKCYRLLEVWKSPARAATR